MDVFSTEAAALRYSDSPPVIIASSSLGAAARAERTIGASGLRIGASVGIEAATTRLDQQGAVSTVWIELDSDCGPATDELLTRVSADVADGRYAAVVAAPVALLDPIAARVVDDGVQLVVDATDADRAAALALAAAAKAQPLALSDVASDQNAERLRQLSDEVSRIASTLARLSAGPALPPRAAEPLPAGEAPAISAETVRAVIRARRLRARYFSEELFADPAWDMLLDLLQAEIAQLRVPVSSLCIAAAVPATTALRWLKMMVSKGLFLRRADPHDGRRVFVELAPETSAALRRYFHDLGQVSVV
jgi:DNA-binding MarR family transcriptional regulator